MKSKQAKELTSSSLHQTYRRIRRFSEALCQPLETEDYLMQTMPEVSPVRWHLAHTSWFFETFILLPMLKNYRTPNPHYNYLFNSYYNAVGEQFPRALRGTQSRPTVKQVFEYRHHVDLGMEQLLSKTGDIVPIDLAMLLTLGCHHEQQHQELMLTDLKHGFFNNPILPVYDASSPPSDLQVRDEASYLPFAGGKIQVGAREAVFAYDNEGPSHPVLTQDFELADRLVTNGEYLKFISDGGYEQSQLWLSDGWTAKQNQNWKAPLYWVHRDKKVFEFTLKGLVELDLSLPVTHLSFYEADAFASWAGARLPTEFEWEQAAGESPVEGNFVDSKHFHPRPASPKQGAKQPRQMFGDVWEWTRSPYCPYPGFQIAHGAVGEYNGKFMANQMVLRGGSCVSSQDHIRASYRNFFYPAARWQFMGMRLARDA